MFLPAKLTNRPNAYVDNQPEERRVPTFGKDAPRVHVKGALLRYSSTTPPMIRERVPGGYRFTPNIPARSA